MKVFWWQGGLHAEPESPEEGKALMLLWKSIHRSSIGAEGANDQPKSVNGSSCSSPARESKEVLKSFVGDR
jgi:hypothetical protein